MRPSKKQESNHEAKDSLLSPHNFALDVIRMGYLYTLAMLVLGIMLVAWPLASVWIVYRAAAVLLMVLGGFRIYKYFRDDVAEGREHQVFAHGAMLAIVGLILMIYLGSLQDWLPVIVGGSLLMVACIRTQAAIDLKRMNHSLWYIPLIVAGLQVIFALLCLVFRIDLMVDLVLCGVALLLEAAADFYCRLMFSHLEKLAKQQTAKEEHKTHGDRPEKPAVVQPEQVPEAQTETQPAPVEPEAETASTDPMEAPKAAAEDHMPSAGAPDGSESTK